MFLRTWMMSLGFALAMSPVHAASEHGMGFVAEPDLVYKSFPGVPRFRAFLPPEVDLSARFPTPRSQGQQGSCTAWAVGYAMRSYYQGQTNHLANFSSDEQVFSPAYIYNQLHTGGKCEGTSISAALDMLVKEGVSPLSEFPYSADDCSRTPDSATQSHAAQFKIKSWRAIEATKLDDAKGQINAGNPVVFGMNISDSFNKLKVGDIYDDIESPRIGGHAMVLVGYSEKRQAFKFINSWGTNWGDQGFGWVSYRALKVLGMRLFVAEAFSAPEPAPVPPKPVVVIPPEPVPPKPVVVIPEPAPAPPKPVVVIPPEPAPVPPKPVVVIPPEPAPVPPKPVVVIPPEPAPEPPKPVVIPEPVPPKPVVVIPPAPVPPKPVVVIPEPVPVPPKPVVVIPVPVPPAPVPPKPVVIIPPAPIPPKPVVVIPPVVIPASKADIVARAQRVACSRIESTFAADRIVHLSGFAGSAEDIAKLRSDLQSLPGVRGVEGDVALHPWPQCEVYLSFEQAMGIHKGLGVHLLGASGQAFKDGDSMSIEVTMPDYPSYVYVTYLQTNGDAVHLEWPNGRFPKQRPANSKLTFGGGKNGEPVYRVGAPFGDEIVVAVASASPLFPEGMPEAAIDREYLTAFRRAFLVQPKDGKGNRVVTAVAATLKTQAK